MKDLGGPPEAGLRGRWRCLPPGTGAQRGAERRRDGGGVCERGWGDRQPRHGRGPELYSLFYATASRPFNKSKYLPSREMLYAAA